MKIERASARRLAVLVLFLCPMASAFAQLGEDEKILDEIYGRELTISLATGNRQTVRRAPAVATVVTAEEIAAMGATDLDDVLETVPGIHVARHTTTYAPNYTVRGVFSPNNPQVLMLQNGIPVTIMYHGNKGGVWGGLPVENIARIEIIRGPASALHGADAYAGAINIVTKTAADIAGTQIGARVASFDSQDAWVLHGGKLGDVDAAAYLRLGGTDGSRQIVRADGQSRNDRIFGTHASLAPGTVNTGRDAVDANLDLAYRQWRLRTNYKLRENVGTGAGVASVLDPDGRARSERITGDLSWTAPDFAGDWSLGFSASALRYNDTVTSPLVLFPAGSRFPTGTFVNGMIGSPNKWERQFRLSAYAVYSGWDGHRLRIGLGHDDMNQFKVESSNNFDYTAAGVPIPLPTIRDPAATPPFIAPARRKVTYFYAQDEWQFARDWSLTAGLRHDRYSDFGGTTNPRIALVWDAAHDLTAKLLAGRAFRAPSFVELYSINNPVQTGNPALQPETVGTVEAALTWEARRDTRINVSVFSYRMQDIVRPVPNATPGTGSTTANTGGQHGKGIELELVWDVTRNLRLSGNHAYQRAIDEASGKDAGYAPHRHLYARADWRFSGGWLSSLQLNRVAGRKRAAGDDRAAIPDYTTVDLTLRTTGSRAAWEFAASARNLFNATVLEPSLAPGLALPYDLPMPGRTWWLQLAHRL